MRRGTGAGHNGRVDADRSSSRFTDPGVSLYALAEQPIQVVCPSCRDRAEVAPRPTEEPRGRYSTAWPRRLVCGGCGHVRDWPGDATGFASHWGCGLDPFFHLPLWLRADCCGGRTLWAFNQPHLDILAGYVAAHLRERGPVGGQTLVARLPTWLKSASNRAEILRTIDRLRATLASKPA
jgi:hypothetical protein